MSLHGLEVEDLYQLRARVQLLLDEHEYEKAADDEEHFYQVLRQHLANLGLPIRSYPLARSHPSYSNLRSGLKSVKKFTDQHFPNSNYTDKRKLYRFYVRLLLDDLEKLKLPKSLWAIAYNVDRIPLLIDKAFPGYAKSGILWQVLERL